MRLKFRFLLLLLFTMHLNAAPGWSGEATITGIYAVSNKQVLLKLTNFTNPANCAVNNDGDIFLDAEIQPNLFSLALSAYMGSKSVNIYVVDSCTGIWANTSYANIGHFRLPKP